MKPIPPGDTIGNWHCRKKESKFSSWMQPLRGYPGGCRWPYIHAKQAAPSELSGFNIKLGKKGSERDRGRIRKEGYGLIKTHFYTYMKFSIKIISKINGPFSVSTITYNFLTIQHYTR